MSRLKQFVSAKWSVGMALLFFGMLCLVALLAPVLSNNKPLYVNVDGEVFFPAFSGDRIIQTTNGTRLDLERIDFTGAVASHVKFVMPLIPYHPSRSDADNSGYKGPFDEQVRFQDGRVKPLKGKSRHLLGTNSLGRDVLASIIYGTRVSLSIGLVSMLLALLIGLTLGSVAGFYKDTGLPINNLQILLLIIATPLIWFYTHVMQYYEANETSIGNIFTSFLITGVIMFVLLWLARRTKLKWLKNKHQVPVDGIISRVIELFTALPKLVLVLALVAVSGAGLGTIILIIGLTGWTRIARYTRAEVLKLSSLDFVNALKVQGVSTVHILFKHLIPNAMGPALINFTFGVASAILLESALSFLGIGVPEETITWGKLLYEGRQYFQAWWMVVFPGLAIFGTIVSLNILADRIQAYLNPKFTRK